MSSVKIEHAEGIRFLREAVDAVDQALACFRVAGTEAQVISDSGVPLRRVFQTLETAYIAAQGAECDDCQKKIADCACAWSNEVLR